ncbi:MAG TPA: BolA family transcriptional regulator [Rhodospirillaceae bacterium]|nr:BolA family transcriptional regulator [Rhodospirillaceae bacterium]
MSVKDIIEGKLVAGLSPSRLAITDDSHRHEGHGGHHPDGESHFSIEIVSPQFAGKSRVDRQRMVYGILAEELRGRVHALALTTLAPGEKGAA